MEVAGEPGDRWLGLMEWGRKAAATKAEREESPDTIVVGSREPVTKRATRLITSGGRHAGFAARQSYARQRVAAG